MGMQIASLAIGVAFNFYLAWTGITSLQVNAILTVLLVVVSFRTQISLYFRFAAKPLVLD